MVHDIHKWEKLPFPKVCNHASVADVIARVDDWERQLNFTPLHPPIPWRG